MVRLALVSDLHGNALALERVLARIAADGADAIVCLGDVATLGPEPERTIELVHECGAVCILGNHDEFLLRPEAVSEYTKVPVVVDAIEWCRSRLSAASLELVRRFRDHWEIPLNARELLSSFHGTPTSNTTDVLATTPSELLDVWLGDVKGTVLAGGHTHLQMVRRHRGRLLVNPGSVGMPFRSYVAGAAPEVLPFADYAMLDADARSVVVTLQRVALDPEELRASVLAVDYPLRAFLAGAYG